MSRASRRRAAGLPWALSLLGIFSDGELAEVIPGLEYRDTEPAPPPESCKVPPQGWECSRDPGHAGPCAASPAGDSEPPSTEPDSAPSVPADGWDDGWL